MQLIITEVTEMNNDMRCVGAWDVEQGAMVRPLPGGAHWPAALVQQHAIVPGSRLTVQPAGNHPSTFPHRTEDTPITAASINNLNDDFLDWFGDEAPECWESLDAGFAGNLQIRDPYRGYHKCFVAPGVQCQSLVGLKVAADGVTFFEDQYRDNPPRLRAHVRDSDRGYDVSVSSLRLRTIWREGGVDAIRAVLPAGDLHLRMGLARAWDDDPNHCWMQLNGLLY